MRRGFGFPENTPEEDFLFLPGIRKESGRSCYGMAAFFAVIGKRSMIRLSFPERKGEEKVRKRAIPVRAVSIPNIIR